MPPVTRSSYQYTSLKDLPSDTIRLLALSPGSGKEPIICDLTNASLSDEVEFSALSYEWGPIDRGYEILLGGKKFRIRENLQQCLLHLRHPQLSICFWIDAICVNQEDLVERGQQVALMGAIYSSAVLVVSWLGAKPAPCTEWLMKIVDWRRAQWADESFALRHKASITAQALTGTAEFVGLPTTSKLLREQWASLTTADQYTKPDSIQQDVAKLFEAWAFTSDLYYRTYWSRVWILQEVLLSKTLLLCSGSQKIPATSFLSLQTVFWTLKSIMLADEIPSNVLNAEINDKRLDLVPMLKSPAYPICEQMGILARVVLQKRPLPEIMNVYKMLRCTDVRDQVYAHLSFASDCDGVVADYTISCADLFWKMLGRNRKDIGGQDIECLLKALQISAASLRGEMDLERSREDICSATVKQWASVLDVLFTKTCHQPLAGGHLELQYHSFVLLSANDVVGESSLALVVSRTPIRPEDTVFVVLDSLIYIICRRQTSTLFALGRAFPFYDSSNSNPDYSKLISKAHVISFGIPRSPLEVGNVAEGQESMWLVNHSKFPVTRLIIMDICEQLL